MLISIDGLDGAGKSTVCAALVKRFEEKLGEGVTSVTSRHLPAKSYDELSGATSSTIGLALQYISDMTDVAAMDVHKIVSPTDWVIWDRGIFSTMVYQIPGFVSGNACAKLAAAHNLYQLYTFCMKAVFSSAGYTSCDVSSIIDRNVLIDTPVAVCIHRVRARLTDDPYENAVDDVWSRRSYDYWKYMSILGQHIVKPTADTPVYAIVDEIWDNCIKPSLRGHHG